MTGKVTKANCPTLEVIAKCNEIVGLTLLLERVLTVKYFLQELESIVDAAQLAIPRVLVGAIASSHIIDTNDNGQSLCESFARCCVSGEFEDPKIPGEIVTAIEAKLRGLSEQQSEDGNSFHKDALNLFKMLIALGKLRSKARINQELIDTIVAFAKMGSFTADPPSSQSIMMMTHANKRLIISDGRSSGSFTPMVNVTDIKEGTPVYSKLEELLEGDNVTFNVVVTVNGKSIYTTWTIRNPIQ